MQPSRTEADRAAGSRDRDSTRRAPREPARRGFLRASLVAGGAFALAVGSTGGARAQPARQPGAAAKPGATSAAAAADGAEELTAWVVIHPDDAVVIRVARSEMGQGSSTGLPMLVAEELDCDWSKVRPEFIDVAEHLRRNRVWGSTSTGGSRSIRDSQQMLRRAGATARAMLVSAAARRWGVRAGECTTAASVVGHPASGRRLRYGELVADAARLTPPAEVPLKDPRDWKLLGKPLPRFDLADKVMGKPVYAIDVQLPGMLYAAIVQCPVFGGAPRTIDAAEALRMRGVKKVVELPDAVAVVADNWWRAQNAARALVIDWDDRGNGKVSSDSIRAFLAAGLDEPVLPVGRRFGDTQTAFTAAARVVEANYYAPFLNHATLEPQVATALLDGGKLSVWTATQSVEGTAAAAAETANIALADVRVHRSMLGGGFGRRGAFQDYTRQAVRIAMAMPGVPVKLLWSREQDMQHGRYRPVTMFRLRGALDASGKLVALHSRIAGQSILAALRATAVTDGVDPQGVACFADLPYEVPNQLVEYAMRNTHVPVGFWRSVAHSQNPFARESFIDELAHAAGRDPYAFRRAMLERSPRDREVLDAVAKAAKWGTPAPAGVHRGIAVQDAYGSYAAAVAELSVEGTRVDIRRVLVAVDPGHVVNADAARAQIEGCVAFALSAILYGQNTLRDGRIEQSNFHDYPILRLAQMPEVVALLVPSGGFWGGMGEPPMAPVAAAVCNALFAATGRRVRSLPLQAEGYTFT